MRTRGCRSWHCHRFYDYDRALFPFPAVTLQKATADQARTLLHDWFRTQTLPDYDGRASALARILFHDPDNAKISDLAQTPLFLWMIAEHFSRIDTLPGSLDQLFDKFSRWCLTERHHNDVNQVPSLEYTYDEKARVLELIATTLVERGVTEVLEAEVLNVIGEQCRAQWEPVLNEIVDSGMLVWDDRLLRFMHQSGVLCGTRSPPRRLGRQRHPARSRP